MRFTKQQEIEKSLSITADRELIRRILAVGREFDVNQGGLYDARISAVNFWCSPEDKPACWIKDPLHGGLDYPRDYVGGLYWDLIEGCKDDFRLWINISPFELGESTRWNITDRQWTECVEWVESHVWHLIRLAGIHETALGTCCPFCDYYLPNDRLLNELIEHIHHHSPVSSVTIMGDCPKVMTDSGEYVLESKTDMLT